MIPISNKYSKEKSWKKYQGFHKNIKEHDNKKKISK